MFTQPREAAEAAREHAIAHFSEYSETILKAWNIAGQPDQFVPPETGATEPAPMAFVP